MKQNTKQVKIIKKDKDVVVATTTTSRGKARAQAEAEDINPAHVKARKEAKERKQKKVADTKKHVKSLTKNDLARIRCATEDKDGAKHVLARANQLIEQGVVLSQSEAIESAMREINVENTTSSKTDKPVGKKTRKPQKRTKVSNYDNVDDGNCPHCILVQPFTQKTLGKDVAGKGDGVTRACKTCQHKWYLNRKIRTCACRTCQKAKKKA